MKHPIRFVALIALITCVLTPSVYPEAQAEEDEGLQFVKGIEQAGWLDEMLEQSGALKDVEQAAAEAFRERLILALERLFEAERNNVFEDADEPMRRMAIDLASACISGQVKAWNVGEAMAVGAVGISLSREILAEGLLQAIAAQDDPANISSPMNDLMRYAYDQDGPDSPMDADLIASKLRKADDRQRDKIIVHLLAYDARQTFRSILETQHEWVKDAASLSWFDRRLQEARWAGRNKVKLDPGFREQLRVDHRALLEHEAWWVRLYAIELGMPVDTDALRRLADDENRYVKARAAALQKKRQ